MRTYKYFHITINPKNCDGSNRNDDYLTKSLIRELDNLLLPLSVNYARAIERNGDHIGHHYHFAFSAKEKWKSMDLQSQVHTCLVKFYELSEAGRKRAVCVRHKTEKQLKLVAYGYITKQYTKLGSSNPNYISNFPDEDLRQYKKEYESLKAKADFNRFSEWVLDCDKKKTAIQHISRYYEVMDIVIKNDEITDISEFNFHKKLYLHILVNYKISFEYNSIKKFHRQILEYLEMSGFSTNIGSETLVNFLKLQKQGLYIETHTENGYKQSKIGEYFEIN